MVSGLAWLLEEVNYIMQKRYTKNQIVEAIRYWVSVLDKYTNNLPSRMLRISVVEKFTVYLQCDII